MSFTMTVKEELCREISGHRHCRLAELAAVLAMSGRIRFDEEGRVSVRIHTENEPAAKKYFTLLKKTFSINTDVVSKQNISGGESFYLMITDDAGAREVLTACGLLAEFDEVTEDCEVAGNPLLARSCCRRAFIRGAFLAAGSVNDPQGAYHFEIACLSAARAAQMVSLMAEFDVTARIVRRKQRYVVYVKEGAQIVDLLNVMGAPLALMEMENVRILKDMRNNVNRKVNCETANINKTVSAAVRQLEDIALIRKRGAFDKLPANVREMALLREEYPEDTLQELGARLTKPVGKSGVNHRFERIHELAESLRAEG